MAELTYSRINQTQIFVIIMMHPRNISFGINRVWINKPIRDLFIYF
eukprot:UN01817